MSRAECVRALDTAFCAFSQQARTTWVVPIFNLV